MTRVRMNGNVDLRIDAGFEEAQTIWQDALANGLLLRVRTQDGDLKAVNPNQVLYLEPSDATPETGEANGRGATRERASA
jgi:hypothetical protein